MPNGRIISLNIGRPVVLVRHGRQYSTAMNRKPVDGPVRLTSTGFEGDRVSDGKAHGGPDRAACCYPIEHYAYWRDRLNAEMPLPSFGENLTTCGLLEDEVCIGDLISIGDALVQITSPRRPCAKLALKHGQPQLPAWINETSFSGFYLRVLEEANIVAGAAIRLVERRHVGMTVALAAGLCVAAEPDARLIEKFINETPLSQPFRESLRGRL